jgi:hypothetical protein
VAGEESGKTAKQQRREQRRGAGRRRRLLRRARGLGIFAAILAVPGLWAFERSGGEELVEAEVIETRLWRHYAGGSTHSHSSATLQIEGLSQTTLDRADGYQRRQRVPVWVRRGRISRWPYFLDLAAAEDVERQRRREEADERKSAQIEIEAEEKR